MKIWEGFFSIMHQKPQHANPPKNINGEIFVNGQTSASIFKCVDDTIK